MASSELKFPNLILFFNFYLFKLIPTADSILIAPNMTKNKIR